MGAPSVLRRGQLDLDAAGGILVDSSFQTSAAGVFAIGDVASFKLATGGSPVRQEHVTHARKSAGHAARAILGELGTGRKEDRGSRVCQPFLPACSSGRLPVVSPPGGRPSQPCIMQWWRFVFMHAG